MTGEAIQLHGGIGITWEHDIQLYHFKRAASSAQFFGQPVDILAATRLLASRWSNARGAGAGVSRRARQVPLKVGPDVGDEFVDRHRRDGLYLQEFPHHPAPPSVRRPVPCASHRRRSPRRPTRTSLSTTSVRKVRSNDSSPRRRRCGRRRPPHPDQGNPTARRSSRMSTSPSLSRGASPGAPPSQSPGRATTSTKRSCFVPEIVVHQGRVGACRGGDRADRRLVEADLGKPASRRGEDHRPRVRRPEPTARPPTAHAVRRRSVAAPRHSATSAKAAMIAMSRHICPVADGCCDTSFSASTA